jgi:hypothetical protein
MQCRYSPNPACWNDSVASPNLLYANGRNILFTHPCGKPTHHFLMYLFGQITRTMESKQHDDNEEGPDEREFNSNVYVWYRASDDTNYGLHLPVGAVPLTLQALRSVHQCTQHVLLQEAHGDTPFVLLHYLRSTNVFELTILDNGPEQRLIDLRRCAEKKGLQPFMDGLLECYQQSVSADGNYITARALELRYNSADEITAGEFVLIASADERETNWGDLRVTMELCIPNVTEV